MLLIIKAQSAPPQSRRGSGLLDTNNKTLASMLSQAGNTSKSKAKSNNKGSDDDDWD